MTPESTVGTTTTAARWERMAALFEGALAVPAAERDAYLREHCPDPKVAAEVRLLLASPAEAAGPIERLMAALGSPAERAWRAPAPYLRFVPQPR